MTGYHLCMSVVFLSTALTAKFYFDLLFESRRKKWVQWAALAAGHLLLYGISLLNHIILNEIFFFMVNALILHFVYQCGFRTSVLQGLCMGFVMSLSEFLIWVPNGIIFKDYMAHRYNLLAMVIFAILSKLLYFWLMVLVARILRPNSSFFRDSGMVLLCCPLPLASIVIILSFVYINMDTELNRSTEILIMISLLILLLSNIFLLFLYAYFQKVSQENFSMQLMLQKESADAAYYAMLEEQSNQQRILIHDIRNHTQTIRSLLDCGKTEEIRQYLSEVSNSPALQRQVRYCENAVLNSLLSRYGTVFREKEIDFHFDIREKTVNFLSLPEITALFGNLLSNGEEAAERSEERLIELSVLDQPEQNTIMIVMENSCPEPPEPDGQEGFFSRKADRLNHGFGLKSIRRIVKKYGGSVKMYFDKERKQFHTVILFPGADKLTFCGPDSGNKV